MSMKKQTWKAAVSAAAIAASAMLPLQSFAEAKSARLLCNGYTGTGTLTDFQALVKLSPENDYGFSYADCAANDGSDLWFTDASGNVIPHEVDTWAHNDDSFVWVKMPSVVPQTDENFPSAVTMHWGDLSAKQTTSDSVWTGFVGVWHMGEASGAEAEPDATTNNLSATPYAASGTYAGDVSVMVPTNGVVGGGRINQTVANKNKGNGLKVTNYASCLTDRSRFTVSGWWWADEKPVGDLHYISSYKGNTDDDMLWVLKAGNISTPTMKALSLDKLTSGGAIGVDSCYGKYVYMTLVYNGTSGALYSNGAMKYSTDSMTAVNIPDSATCWIGYYGKSARAAWCGRYDEVRMYNGAQSADRIVADYATMSTPSAFLVGDGSIARATWTGAAGDGDIGKSANWNCYDASGNLKPGELPTEVTAVTVSGANVKMQVPAGTTLVADSVTISSCTLGADCDWRGLASLPCSFDGVVDLSGRSLTVAALAGDGIITNSVSGDAAQLCISNVAEVVNSTVAIGGNVTLVKDGPGKFTSAKEQTYTGGTIVAAGTARPPASGGSQTEGTDLTYSWDNFKAFGTGEIKVLPDAAFDLRGAFAYRDTIVLAGGTLKNTGTMYMVTAAEGSGVGRLEADSFIDAESSIVFGSTNENHLCDLAGHTLSLTNLASSKFFNLETSFTDNPGKFTTLALPVRTGWFRVPEGFTVMATNVDFEISCRIDIGGNLYLHDYTAAYVGTYIQGEGNIFVYGTFKPGETNEVGASCFHGCTLMDGSTIDLADKGAPWPVSSYAGGSTKLVTFADGARVNVNIGSRRIAKDEAVMTWTNATRPTNLGTLTFRSVVNGREVTLTKDSDGLYLRRGLVLIFK